MKPFQWIFHYLEIKDMNGDDKQLLNDRIQDLETSIQAFYLLVDKSADSQGAKTLMKNIANVKEERYKNRIKLKNGKTNNNVDDTKNEELPDLLNDEDKELWSFMEAQPETMDVGDMKEETQYLLPKKSRKDIINSQAKIVESSDTINKPKLGF